MGAIKLLGGVVAQSSGDDHGILIGEVSVRLDSELSERIGLGLLLLGLSDSDDALWYMLGFDFANAVATMFVLNPPHQLNGSESKHHPKVHMRVLNDIHSV
ncbi:hypothetical protein DEO72_LG5g918 [Vigna unguiculata]|uniref:Uncharacterized protein n=1 Tax=Vigna unguiculata TaxID=3917 RepID=A0A4D6LUV9_VIGUN|nr:hypothetical protein DEO72_LG5g918 [Vigna unguiculata]